VIADFDIDMRRFAGGWLILHHKPHQLMFLDAESGAALQDYIAATAEGKAPGPGQLPANLRSVLIFLQSAKMDATRQGAPLAEDGHRATPASLWLRPAERIVGLSVEPHLRTTVLNAQLNAITSEEAPADAPVLRLYERQGRYLLDDGTDYLADEADAAQARWWLLRSLWRKSSESEETALLHGAALSLEGRTLLLCGAGGSGKSTLSLRSPRRGRNS